MILPTSRGHRQTTSESIEDPSRIKLAIGRSQGIPSGSKRMQPLLPHAAEFADEPIGPDTVRTRAEGSLGV